MNIRLLLFLMISLSTLAAPSGAATVRVAANDPAIAFDGVLFPKSSPERTTFARFDEATLDSPDTNFDRHRAAPAPGAVIRFTTASANIEAKFASQPGENRGATFGVFRDGALVQQEHFDKDKTDLSFVVRSPGARAATYEISLPSWASVAFLGLGLDEGQTLLPNPPDTRPAYVAIGDSITHGVGQGSASFKTYPFLLARAMGWEGFNLGVGGGKTSPSLGAMLAGKRVDAVTILVGYNDWNTHADPAIYRRDYAALIANLRKSHPQVPIYCVTATVITNTISRSKKPAPLEAFREVVCSIVSERVAQGDKQIFVIEGLSVTNKADLGDTVHLSSEGAQHLAENLAKAIRR